MQCSICTRKLGSLYDEDKKFELQIVMCLDCYVDAKIEELKDKIERAIGDQSTQEDLTNEVH